MSKQYPWFEVVSGDKILQGDFIDNCPILVPSSNLSSEQDIEAITYDVIVMSQSCDLEQSKIDIVLVCPYWTLKDFGEVNTLYQNCDAREALRRGLYPGYHLIKKCEEKGFQKEEIVVNFRSVYGVHIKALKELATKQDKRLRLLPPFREHLSQAFARFFMRVGLPSDIPPFTKARTDELIKIL
jgi:hypothetical protein